MYGKRIFQRKTIKTRNFSVFLFSFLFACVKTFHIAFYLRSHSLSIVHIFFMLFFVCFLFFFFKFFFCNFFIRFLSVSVLPSYCLCHSVDVDLKVLPRKIIASLSIRCQINFLPIACTLIRDLCVF